jgi:diacylglycerol kinase family enzyme
MDATVILNPAAGKGRARTRFSSYAGLPEAWRRRAAIDTRGPGDAEAIAREVTRAGSELIVAVGGDGTVHEVVNGMLGAGAESLPLLAHLPVGTGCDFARGLDLAAAPVAQWRPRSVDVGCFEYGEGQRRWFVNAANIGLGPQVARWVSRSGWRHAGPTVYLVGAALAVLVFRPGPLTVREGPQASSRPTLNLSICNGRFFGGGMQPCPEARLDSGQLHVAWIGNMGRLAAWMRLRGLMRGRMRGHPALERRVSRELHVEGNALVEVDGELAGPLPGRFSLIPRGLQVLAPEPGEPGETD